MFLYVKLYFNDLRCYLVSWSLCGQWFEPVSCSGLGVKPLTIIDWLRIYPFATVFFSGVGNLNFFFFENGIVVVVVLSRRYSYLKYYFSFLANFKGLMFVPDIGVNFFFNFLIRIFLCFASIKKKLILV